MDLKLVFYFFQQTVKRFTSATGFHNKSLLISRQVSEVFYKRGPELRKETI